ncbi:MAG: prepilin-type N-terminal cleavage/methylation domain-containing protein [Candidatus Cloacimonetes bacterium]|nr:prepilin-type N-terminal cleavage/methylation domain-containing protein [Candidatus Cloacimonadota bacterium]
MTKRGMTLVEVLAALAVLSALLVPIFLMISFSSKAVYRSTNDILAASVALERIEKLRSLPYFKMENILLGFDENMTQRPPSSKVLFGPFETYQEQPDIVQPNCYTSGSVVFQCYTYLSYFPEPNPDPNDPKFDEKRKRIRAKVRIFWKDRLSSSVYVDQDLTFDTLIHDENYNPKPLLDSYGEDSN